MELPRDALIGVAAQFVSHAYTQNGLLLWMLVGPSPHHLVREMYLIKGEEHHAWDNETDFDGGVHPHLSELSRALRANIAVLFTARWGPYPARSYPDSG